MSERTAVYRLYSADDVLLYVGVSRRPTARFKHHATSQPWWSEVSRHEIAWHPDRDGAIGEETLCIREDRPRYNAAVPQADGKFTSVSRRLVKEGVSLRHLRLPDELWDRFGGAVKEADPDGNRTQVIRRLLRWYVGDIDEMPQRPAPKPGEK